jgi:hypothetical protein
LTLSGHRPDQNPAAERKWLHAIIHEGDAEAVVKEKQEKATVEDFNWILWTIVRPAA